MSDEGVEIYPAAAYSFAPIGFIETPFKERFGTPRQPGLVPSSWGKVHLRPELNLSDALEGLQDFSHIWLVFVFHENTNKGIKTKVHPPRLEGGKIGLFATRTPHRPNPIGLSAVKLERIKGSCLYLSGVDLLDRTPILDIKPYLPSSDSIAGATSGWTQDRAERSIKVVFTSDVEQAIDSKLGSEAFRFQAIVREILELDPRPNFYKGTEANRNPYTDVYGIRVEDWNVVYQMAGETATVVKIVPWQEHQNRR